MNELSLATQLAPPRIADDAGVGLAVHHLEFVGLQAASLGDWRARRAPLGMTPAQYREFRLDFFNAIAQDHLFDFDARLKGSSTAIFSGLHKQLPANRVELAHAFDQIRNVRPLPAEEDHMDAQREKLWALQAYPRRRPFDSMFHLGADPLPSDYDVQLSSQDIEAQCRALYQNATPPAVAPLVHPKYGFLLSTIVDQVIPAIMAWADQWTLRLNRDVNVKVFGGAGPPNVTLQAGELSSHYRAADWIISPVQPGVD